MLAQLDEDIPWQEARQPRLRIHDILQLIHRDFGRQYAENSRETVRRRVIHQFEQARLVNRNPDDPALPTNSPHTHYALSNNAVQLIRQFDSPEWQSALKAFLDNQQTLSEQYIRAQEREMIALVYKGEVYRLSPGAHNVLQVAIIEQFGPRFAPGASLLYLGDTADKSLLVDEQAFHELNITLTQHDKLPDIILYDASRNWLFLIEAVTSHGPVTSKRRLELEEMLVDCPAGRIYISAFPDFVTFRKFLSAIAWETEVWLSEMPDHMIHFNGDRFIGPRS